VTILIRSTLKKRVLTVRSVRARAEALRAAAGLRDTGLSILLVGDRTMRSLNRRYRGKDRTTDVLSFSLREGQGAVASHRLLGDIVISVPAARRQAREAGHSLRAEVDRLLVHGLLHLLGYDHERGKAEERRMRARERRLQEALRP
jgi:probable rRNA maturation factor